MSTDEKILQETLIKACLHGINHAWQRLIEKYDSPLRESIKAHLGFLTRDEHLVDDLTAEVWIFLSTHQGGGLPAYDSGRAGFATYLNLVAKQKVQQYRRRQCRPPHVQVVSLDREPVDSQGASLPTGIWMEDFLSTLTPREALFCRAHLLEIPDSGPLPPLTSENVRKLTQRVREKLLAYFNRPRQPKPLKKSKTVCHKSTSRRNI